MTAVFFIILILIIICLTVIWYANTYNKYQNLIIRINEVEANIDTVLRKRFDLLNKSINIIKANCEDVGDVLGNIVKLRSRKLSNFDLDRHLYDAINEFNSFKDNYPSLKECSNFMKISLSLEDTEIEISALRKYYNDTITDYNKLLRNFPSNIVGKISRHKEKTYFDGKNMNDDITNDFKL